MQDPGQVPARERKEEGKERERRGEERVGGKRRGREGVEGGRGGKEERKREERGWGRGIAEERERKESPLLSQPQQGSEVLDPGQAIQWVAAECVHQQAAGTGTNTPGHHGHSLLLRASPASHLLQTGSSLSMALCVLSELRTVSLQV
jgi:hypothetical protein